MSKMTCDRDLFKWNSEFPKNCPPDKARSTRQEVFRATQNNPPELEDFISLKKMHPNIDYSHIDCQSRGLSVFPSKEDILKMKKRTPGFRKKCKYIASGIIEKDMGVLMHTESRNSKHHLTWWVPVNKEKEIYTYFKVI